MESNMQTSSLFELQLDHEASIYLKDAARWAKFLAILGFIGCGLMALGSLSIGSSVATSYAAVGMGSALGAGVTVLYILIALLYFFPCLYTYNFAKKMQLALNNNDQVQLNQSFRNLKSCFRFLGILTLIFLCLAALGIVVTLIGLAVR